jgi:hypothetical protein
LTVRGGPGVSGGDEGLYIRIWLGFKEIARSTESAVEFLFVENGVLNLVVPVATIYRPPNTNTSVVYHSLDGDYGLQALEEIFSGLLPLYLLDPGNSLFPRFLGYVYVMHDMIFLSCCFERSRVATLYKSIRSFRDIDRHGLLGADALCTGVQFGLWLE